MKNRPPVPSLRRVFGVLLGVGLVLALPSISSAQEDLEVLTRGPVHEAFADAVSYEVEPGLIVNVAPPEPIEELPPEQRPEGEYVEWIPGYWAWEEEQTDFLWVSGIWRNLPPERRWVPGYWSDLQDDRWQWTSGYWADATDKEVAYIVTEPPRSVEAGPNIPAPSVEHVWTPGVWSWRDTRYAWRPGQWRPLREDWTWVPARYCWTPRGYVFVDGYWDYAVDRRGVLFAPVRFHRHPGHHANYRYTPSVVVGLEVFLDHLFYRPRSCHYYFGDYYDSRYRNAGWYSAFRWHDSRRGYDPIYCHQRWHHRSDRDWDRRHRERYDFYEKNVAVRPRHTWAAMKAQRGKAGKDDRERYYAEPLADFAAGSGISKKFRPLAKEERDRIVSQGKEIRKISKERDRLERGPRDPKRTGREKQSVERERMAATSIVGNQLDKADRKGGPPPRSAALGKQAKPTGAKSSAEVSRPKGPKPKEERDAQKPDKAPRGSEVRSAPKNDERPVPSKEVRPAPKKESRPAPSREVRPAPKKESQPAPSREVRPAPKKESQPAPSRVVRPAPKKESQPAPSREVRPAPKKESRPAPSREVRPAPKKESQPAPSRVVRPAPKRESRPAPSRVVRPAPKKESRPAPRREVRPAPKKESRPAPKKVTRPAPKREVKSAPKRSTPPTARNSSPSRGKEKKQDKGSSSKGKGKRK